MKDWGLPGTDNHVLAPLTAVLSEVRSGAEPGSTTGGSGSVRESGASAATGQGEQGGEGLITHQNHCVLVPAASAGTQGT